MPTQLAPFWPHLVTTLQQRPYVFAFLACFLVFAPLQLGWRRTLAFLGMGWLVAFASEVSSIRNGFPYGDYQYVYENLKGELLLWGVPLWDSLSYTFLAYASYSTALLLTRSRDSQSPTPGLPERSSWKVLLLSILLMTGIDVVIDPLTNMGDRWFLGRIYYYPGGGTYFGVTLSNFAGWAIVAFAIVGIFQVLDRWIEKRGGRLDPEAWKGLRAYLGAALYLGVYFFNWGITLWLREWNLAAADLLLVSPLIAALVLTRRRADAAPNFRSAADRAEKAPTS